MKDKAAFIIQAFKQLGVTLSPASRLAQQADVYLDRKGILPQIIEPNHPLFQTATEAYRDLNQVAYSLKHLLHFAPNEEMKKRLRLLVADNVLPQDDPRLSPGRDVQFELFVAALCARAGLKPVFTESPDLRCILSNQDFGLEIKRIKAPKEGFDNAFQRRMRHAAEQIQRAGVGGIIITDVSQSLNPTNWRVPIEVSDSQFNRAREAQLAQFKSQFEMSLFAWTRGKGVRGVIIVNHVIRCSPTKIWQMELWADSLNLSLTNQRRRREFELFDSHLQRAIFDPGENQV